MGLHDVYEPLDPPYRRGTLYKPSDRIGLPYVQGDPKKLSVWWKPIGRTARSFAAADPLTDKSGRTWPTSLPRI